MKVLEGDFMPHCEGITRHQSVTVGEREQNANTKCLPINLLWHLNVSLRYFKEYYGTWPKKKTYVHGTLSERSELTVLILSS